MNRSIIAGFLVGLVLGAVVPKLGACGGDNDVAEAIAEPAPELSTSKLTPHENYYWQRAKAYFNNPDAVEPSVTYSVETDCGNGTMCCASGCAPYHMESCYWDFRYGRNDVVVARNQGGRDACASIDRKLRVEMCNSSAWQAGIYRDQWGAGCDHS